MGRRAGARLTAAPRIALAPAAAGGLVAGHFLTYVFVAPAGPARAAILRHTGHVYFPRAVAAAAALGAIAMGAAVARGVARRHSHAPSLAWRGLALRMAAAQAVGFVILEVVERAIVGAPIGGVAAVLPIGFAVEMLVAAAVAALLCVTVRAAETVARRLSSIAPRRARVPLVSGIPARALDVRPALDVLSHSVGVRGPPEALAA